MEQRYAPTTDDLSLVLDTQVRFVTSSSMQRFAENLRGKQYDIALVAPGMFIHTAYPLNYQLLAQVAKPLTFELVVRKNSDIHSINDIKDHLIGTMQPQTATSYGIQLLTENNGLDINQLKTKSFGSQSACTQALLSRLVDACSFASGIFEVTRAQYPNKFRSLATSPPFPGSIYVAHPKMPTESVELLREYFVAQAKLIEADINDYAIYQKFLKN